MASTLPVVVVMKIAIRGQPRHRAVIYDSAAVGAHDPVPYSPDAKGGKGVGVHPVQEGRGVFPDDLQLAQRTQVDDADPLVDGLGFFHWGGVAEGPSPLAQVHHRGAQGPLAVLQGAGFHGHVALPGEQPQRCGREGRAGCGGSRLFHAQSGKLRRDPAEGAGAHPALARAHGGGAVALERLNVSEALVDGVGQVLFGHVLANADESLPAGPACGLVPERYALLIAPDHLRQPSLEDGRFLGVLLAPEAGGGPSTGQTPLKQRRFEVEDACDVTGGVDVGWVSRRYNFAQ